MKNYFTPDPNESQAPGFIVAVLTMATLVLAIGWFLSLFFIAQICWSRIGACANAGVVLTSVVALIFFVLDASFCLLRSIRKLRWIWFALLVAQLGIAWAMQR